VVIKLPSDERVVTVYLPVVGRRDEGSCCVSTLVLSGVANEPSVE
jgi:hypothetical protein